MQYIIHIYYTQYILAKFYMEDPHIIVSGKYCVDSEKNSIKLFMFDNINVYINVHSMFININAYVYV